VWASDIRYSVGDTALLFAKLETPTATVADLLSPLPTSAKGPWTINGELVDSNGQALGALTYSDDGEGVDAHAGDGIYTASFTLPAAQQPDLGTAKNIAVKVTASNAKQEQRVALGGFLFSRPGAQLSGEYQDRVSEGSLVIAAKLEVNVAGRYHIAGVLASTLGESIALAQSAAYFEPGVHWLELKFYGLVLREAGVAGPYSLNSVTLTTAGSMPNALGPVLNAVHVSQPYVTSMFTNKPFNRPDLLDAAVRLEGLVKR
jgi:hypothetical protein